MYDARCNAFKTGRLISIILNKIDTQHETYSENYEKIASKIDKVSNKRNTATSISGIFCVRLDADVN